MAGDMKLECMVSRWVWVWS